MRSKTKIALALEIAMNPESIPHATGGMIFRNIDGDEIVIIIGQTISLINHVTHALEIIFKFKFDTSEGVKMASLVTCGRQRNIVPAITRMTDAIIINA